AALPETEERPAQRLAHGAFAAGRRALRQEARRALAAELAESVGQRCGLRTVEQWGDAVVRRVAAAHDRGLETEPSQRGQGGVPPLAHGDDSPSGAAAARAAAPVGSTAPVGPATSVATRRRR